MPPSTSIGGDRGFAWRVLELRKSRRMAPHRVVWSCNRTSGIASAFDMPEGRTNAPGLSTAALPSSSLEFLEVIDQRQCGAVPGEEAGTVQGPACEVVSQPGIGESLADGGGDRCGVGG